MTSPRLERAVTEARSSLEEEAEWSMMNSIPLGVTGVLPDDVPGEYADFLRLADGAIFGRVVVFGAKIVAKMQFYADDQEGAPVPLGRDKWFCFGKVNEDPLFIERSTGAVWGFPDTGVVWWQSETFERLAAGLGEFLEKYALGPEYPALSGAPEGEQWRRLLGNIGRA